MNNNPFCKCLHEIENQLPRTQYCFISCYGQHEILREHRAGELKTSEAWLKLVPHECKLLLIDPDGWDRTNFDYSFKDELISKYEFKSRLFESTIQCNHELFLKW